MYEESESERYREKLKNDYKEFVHNQDVYQTLTKFNKETYGNIIETAILAFHCPAEELDMDNLKALEGYLKMSKNKYHALVNDDEENKIEISDEEEPEPLKHPEVKKFNEINYHMPREIPTFTNNIYESPQIHQWNNGYIHQNMVLPPPWNPWRGHVPNFGIHSGCNVPQCPPQIQPVINIPPPPVPQFDAITRPGSSFMFNKSTCPLPQQKQFPEYKQIRPSYSHQIVPEKPVAKTYGEHKFMKQQVKERQERERNDQKKLQLTQNRNKPSNFLIRKEQIENYNKRESDGHASTSSKQSEPIKSALKAVSTENKKTVTWNDNANRCLTYDRELNESINSCDEIASSISVSELPSTSKIHISSEKDKSLNEILKPQKNAADPPKSIENDQKGSKKAVDKPGNSKVKSNEKVGVSSKCKVNNQKGTEKAAVPFKSNEKDKNKVPKKAVNDKNESSKVIEKVPDIGKSKKIIKELSKTEKPAKLVVKESDQKKGSKTQKSVAELRPGSSKDEGKITKLKVIQAKPIKLLKDVDCLFKRKSDSPVKDLAKPKRMKKSTNEDKNESGSEVQIKEANSMVNIVIKEEQISEDENFDGKTVVSSNNDNIDKPEKLQQMESDHIRIKQENEFNMNDTASTIGIKEEVMSIIDQENSSIHSEKMDVNAIAENFIKVCDNPDFLNSIEELIDFSEYEVLTEDAVNSNNNNSEVIEINLQEKCASWLEHIDNSDFDRTTKSPNNDVQFYSTKDEETEPDDDIIPYFPVRQLGAPEIIPKKEKK